MKFIADASLDDTSGLMDVYEGHLEAGKLQLTNEKTGTWFVRPGGTAVKFRLTYQLEPGHVSMLIDESPPDLQEWHPFMMIEYECSNAEAPPPVSLGN